MPVVVPQNNRVQVSVGVDLFSHQNSQAVIQVEVRQVNGRPLPGWLRYDPEQQVLTGNPPPGMTGTLKLVVIAKDQFGGEARTELTINLDAKK